VARTMRDLLDSKMRPLSSTIRSLLASPAVRLLTLVWVQSRAVALSAPLPNASSAKEAQVCNQIAEDCFVRGRAVNRTYSAVIISAVLTCIAPKTNTHAALWCLAGSNKYWLATLGACE
jgi:hypothetical protein